MARVSTLRQSASSNELSCQSANGLPSTLFVVGVCPHCDIPKSLYADIQQVYRKRWRQALHPTRCLAKKTGTPSGVRAHRQSTAVEPEPILLTSGRLTPRPPFNSHSFSQNGGAESGSSTPAVRGTPLPRMPSSHRPTRLPRIHIASLLSDTEGTRKYHLEVIQQPLKGAEFQNSPLSRLAVTPPLIVRLTITDPSGNPIMPDGELPFLIAHLSLYNENGTTRLDMGSSPYRQIAPILYGNLVSTVEYLEDLQGNMGLFFIFPDASVRWQGRYQLGITLSRISRFSPDESGIIEDSYPGTFLAETRTAAFEVFPRAYYAAAAPTRLTQCFIRQGARLLALPPTL